MCNTVCCSFIRHYFTTCFRLNGYLQLERLFYFRTLLLTLVRFSFSCCYSLIIFGYVGCMWLFFYNVWCTMLELYIYIYIQLLNVWCYFLLCSVYWLWLPSVFLLGWEFCCVLVGHHSHFLWVFSLHQFCCCLRIGVCCMLLSGVCFM
jgi:hypothetical protein